MRFWDSSALTPLLVNEPDSLAREAALEQDHEIVVWYATQVELESAIARRRREGMPVVDERAARARLRLLVDAWHEIQPTAVLRDRAIRLLRVHPLRSADAFQLAAALVVCRDNPAGAAFLTGDARLREAAEREGFDAS